MRLQTKILAGYLVLVAVICSMAAILVHERGRMREIEAETGEIQEIRLGIGTAQRSITTLATLGEGIISYLAIHREMKRSGNERKKRVVRMAVLHTEGDTVMADTLEFDEMPMADDASLALNDMEKKQIIHALEQAKGNRKLAAVLLGIYFIQCIYCLSATCKTNRKKSHPLDCRLPDSFMCAHFNPSVTT